ncbi:MAG TPA: DNRLRE domain-containing protein, partial [Dehalococcoidia bacterium]
PAGASVASATFTLCPTRTNPDAAGRVHEVSRALGAWSESAVDWNNQPPALSPPTASSAYLGGLGCVNFDVTADVVAWVGGAANFGWLVKDEIEDSSGCAVTYGSRENDDTSLAPTLTVTFAFSGGLPAAAPSGEGASYAGALAMPGAFGVGFGY